MEISTELVLVALNESVTAKGKIHLPDLKEFAEENSIKLKAGQTWGDLLPIPVGAKETINIEGEPDELLVRLKEKYSNIPEVTEPTPEEEDIAANEKEIETKDPAEPQESSDVQAGEDNKDVSEEKAGEVKGAEDKDTGKDPSPKKETKTKTRTKKASPKKRAKDESGADDEPSFKEETSFPTIELDWDPDPEVEFELKSDELLSIIKPLKKVMTGSISVPILDTILFTCKDNLLEIRASSFQAEAYDTLVLDAPDFCFAVNRDTLETVLSNINATISFRLETTKDSSTGEFDQKIHMSYKNSTMFLKTMDYMLFPRKINVGESMCSLHLRAEDVKKVKSIGDFTRWTASDPMRGGVHLLKEGKELFVEATNGDVAARKKVLRNMKCDLDICIQNQYVGVMDGFFGKSNVSMDFLRSYIEGVTKADKIAIYHVVIKDGNSGKTLVVPGVGATAFPNISGAISLADFTNRFTIGTKEFMKIIDQAYVFANKSSKLISFELEAGKLKVFTNNPDFGQGFSTEESVITSGEPSSFKIEYSFISKVLSKIETDKVVIGHGIQLATGAVPVFLKSSHEDDMYLVTTFRDDAGQI